MLALIILSSLVYSVKAYDYLAALRGSLEDYSKLSRPNPLKDFYPQLNGTTRLLPCVIAGTHFIEVKIQIEKLFNFNVKSEGFEATVTIHMRWLDSQLRHIKLDSDITPLLDDIWIPDVVFVNARESSTEQDQNSLTNLHFKDGIVTMRKRFKLKVSCDLDLKNFPFDRQTCDITIGSLGSKRNDMDLIWWTREELDIFGFDRDNQKIYNNALDMETLRVGEMEITGKTARYCGGKETSCLKVVIAFKRDVAFYLSHAYMPSTFIVLLSWQAFFINPEDAAVRLSIGMLSVFALVTQTSSLSKNLPVLPYFNSIDVWLVGCQIQILTYIILYVFVHLRVNAKKSKLQTKADQRNRINSEIKIKAYMAVEKFNIIKINNTNNDEKIRKTKFSTYAEYCWTNTSISMEAVDSMSRVLFPFTFVLYIGFYIALVVR